MSEFDDFVRRQQEKKDEAGGQDVSQQLQEWRDLLSKLYSDIESYMASYLSDQRASIVYENIEINEEFSGPYKVKQMTLVIGPSSILFKPIGTMLIATKGRVDVHGPYGNARLVLIDRKIKAARDFIKVTVSVSGNPAAAPRVEREEPVEWVWKLATPPPDIRMLELTEKTFFDMILSIADA